MLDPDVSSNMLDTILTSDVVEIILEKEMGVVKPNLGRRRLLASIGAGIVVGAAAGFTLGRLTAPAAPPIAEELNKIIAERKLELSHAKAALKTYVPGGGRDEFIMFSSGGHSGQVLVIGVPSMRLLKVIAVFTPEPWQGYGYGDVKTMKLLYKGSNGVRLLTLGDTHHPEISKTRGEYDGEWLFIGDKLNARMASISLKDFETKDIVKLPNTQTQHGGACATPNNTEYVACASQFLFRWALRASFSDRRSVDEAAESHSGVHTRALAGIWLRRCEDDEAALQGIQRCQALNTG
jgi:nitrous oxide reductase